MGKDCPYSIQNNHKSVVREIKTGVSGTKHPKLSQITKHKCP